MSICVILDLGTEKIVVKKDNFSSVIYNRAGSVHSFVKGDKLYISCVKKDVFFGFLESVNFNKQNERYYNKVKKERVTDADWRLGEFNSFSSLAVAENGDILEGAFFIFNNDGRCGQLYHYTYNGIIPTEVQFKQTTSGPPFDCENFGGITTPAGKFFDKYKNESFWDTNQADINLIGEIASLLEEAGEKAATAFIDFTLSNSVTNDFLFYDNNGNGYSRQQFLEYKRGLKRWLAILKEYSSQIGKLTYGEKLFLAVNYMYRHNMLTMVSIPDRINILKILVEKKSLTWAWVNADYGFIHTEDLTLYVLKSVTTQPDAILFLDKLVSTNVIRYEVKDHQETTIDTVYTTLYKLLFYRMDDYFGQDNFTNFTKELERIVKLKHNVPDPTPEYTIQQLQQLTTAQFFWRENGPKFGRIKYKIVTTDTKVKIKETICTQTELKPVYTSNGVAGASVTVITGYEEVCVDSEDINFTLNHFDLIAIYFYSNPSFIDLYEDEAYEGKLFITFAGFFDYIHEKEQTKIWENVFNNALFVVSLAVGIGELAAAVRTVNFARAFLGLTIVTSDTALYIVTGTPFHNYIITTYGQQRGSEIISNLTLLSTITSLGTNALAGYGILKAYSREEGLKLVGTGEAILKDSNATIHMTSMEINALEDAIKRIKNEFYAIRNEQDAVNTIVRTKSAVFFNKFPSIKNELEMITEASRHKFYDDFVNISEDFLKELDKTPDFIPYWDNLSDAEKLSFKLDKVMKYKAWYVSKVSEEAVLMRNSGLWQDIRRGAPNTSNANKGLNELESLVDLKIQFKLDIERSLYFEAGDARCFAGQFQGKSIDVMGRLSQQALETQWTLKPTKAMKDFRNSIKDHFKKITNPEPNVPALDILVIDLKGFNQSRTDEIYNFLQSEFPTYLNPQHPDFEKLIILNKE